MKIINCIKLGKELEGFEISPFFGELGEQILDNISKEAWGQWLDFQTMLINENNLNLMDEKSQSYLKEQMKAFLFGGDIDKIAGYKPK